MPLDAVIVLVIEHRQTGLVIELLVSLYCEAAGVLHVCQLARLDSRVVVWLGLVILPWSAPKCQSAGDVGRRNSFVAWEIGRFLNIFSNFSFFQSTVSPKPTIDIDWLEMLSVTAFVLEVAFSPRGVNRADVVPVHHLGEVSIFLRVLKWHKIHASFTTKVPVWKGTNDFVKLRSRSWSQGVIQWV